MDGITILNTYMDYLKSTIAIMLFTGMLGGLFVFIGLYIKFDIDSDWGCIVSAIGIILLIYTLIYTPKTEHIQAVIDDSVSWVELTNKYEIIKSEGQIITMIEKKQNDDN